MRTYKLWFSTGITWVPEVNQLHAENLGMLWSSEDPVFGTFIAARQVPYNQTLHYQFISREMIEECNC